MEDKSNANESIYKYQPLWGSWKVVEKIGEGSFGKVYKVCKEEKGFIYEAAVKLITIPSEEQLKEVNASFGNDEKIIFGYFKDLVDCIVNEINLLYKLSGNTNIINYQDHQIIEKDELKCDILIRMEYAVPLTKYIEKNKLTEKSIIKLGIDICTALEICQKEGIIHRDIKDDNLFVSTNGNFKLGDFGVSRILNDNNRTASVKGSPIYMAPELLRHEKYYDGTVDLYSLGLVLYKLLNNGRMPFLPQYPEPITVKDKEKSLEKRIMGEILPLPSNCDELLGKIILKACEYEPSNRYKSPTEFKNVLQIEYDKRGYSENDSFATLDVDKDESGEKNKSKKSGYNDIERTIAFAKNEEKNSNLYNESLKLNDSKTIFKQSDYLEKTLEGQPYTNVVTSYEHPQFQYINNNFNDSNKSIKQKGFKSKKMLSYFVIFIAVFILFFEFRGGYIFSLKDIFNKFNNAQAKNTSKNASNKPVDMTGKTGYYEVRLKDGFYMGYFVDGKRDGNGIMEYDNGSKYDGEWKNDKREGKGVFISPIGDKYSGEWKDDKREGKGQLQYASGDLYDGDWKEGLKNGYGVYRWNNGEVYSGYWESDLFNGYGKYEYSNGDWYSGIWKNGKRHGFGIYYSKEANKTKLRLWNEDKMVE